jgi:6-phosphogluconolactonase (cycloisomerase 2 family)
MTAKLLSALIPVLLLVSATSAEANDSASRAVYTQSNAADGNEVLVFRRHAHGELQPAGRVRTHGLGTGAGLGSQGSVLLTRDGEHLYVVNAGSDTISAFSVGRRGLSLIGRVGSGGDQPISLTLRFGILYVLNAGTESNISGFRVAHDGRLRPLRNSTRPLSAAAVQPAQVQFNNTGDFLVVTEKATNKIDLYAVDDGTARGPFVRDSNGITPFGFAFDRRDRLVVSEAFMDAPGASAVSSYDFDAAEAPLEVVSGSVKTMQTSACWVAITRLGRYAYVTNTGSGTISGYAIARDGTLALLAPNGISASTGAGSLPQDLALTRRSDFLFALAPGTGSLVTFRVLADGSLRHVDTAQGIPASAQGLAAH